MARSRRQLEESAQAARDGWPVVAGVVAAAAIFLVLAVLYFGYTIDDAYISLRYARHVAAGEGFAFDARVPPVEGYTNFLWVLCEVPIYALRLPGEAVIYAKVLGIAWGLVAIGAAFFLARRLFGVGAGVVAALAFAALGNVAFWAVAGLETAQYLCLVIIALFFTLAGAGRPAGGVIAGAAWFLAALARPEGFVLACVVLASALIFGGPAGARRRVLFAAVVLTVAYGVYFVWRWYYFGAFLPNTFYARAGFSAATLAGRVRGVVPFLIYMAPVAAGAWALGRGDRDPRVRVLWAAVLASLALAFAARREWMPGFRYELPFAVLAWLAFAGAWVKLIRGRRRLVGAALTAAVLIYASVPGTFLLKEVSYTEGLRRAHVALGKWLAGAAPPESSLATWDMGALPYFSEFPIIYDINPEGLLSRETTSRGYAPAYFFERRPTFFVLYSASPTRAAVPGRHWAARYYESPVLIQEYEYLFTFTMRREYHLRVYALKGVSLSSEELAAGARLAGRSRAAASCGL